MKGVVLQLGGWVRGNSSIP